MHRKRMTCLSGLLLVPFLVLIMWPAPLPAYAQEPLTEHYTSTSGALSFSYPVGWVFNDENGMIALTNDATALYTDVLPPGTVGMIIFEPAALSRLLNGVNTQALADMGSYIAPLLGDGEIEFELLDSQAIRIANHSATRLDGHSTVADGLILVIDHGEGNLVAVAAMVSPGSIDESQETIMAIAASIVLSPSQPVIIRAHSDYIKAVAFSPDGTLLASASNDHTVRVWDVTTGIEVLTLSHDNWVNAVAFSPDGVLLATGAMQGFGGVVRIWDVTTSELIAELLHTSYVTSVAFNSDGTLLTSGSENDKLVHLWELGGAWQELASFSGHTDYVNSVVFSPDGTLLASGSADGTTRVWDIAAGTEILKLEHPAYVNSVAISPDGALLASGCADGIVRLWNTATGKSSAELTGHISDITSVTFSPDGRLLASASHDKSVRLWIFDGTWQELAVFSGHTDWVRSVAFSPDGRLVASGSDDGTVILWNVP